MLLHFASPTLRHCSLVLMSQKARAPAETIDKSCSTLRNMNQQPQAYAVSMRARFPVLRHWLVADYEWSVQDKNATLHTLQSITYLWFAQEGSRSPSASMLVGPLSTCCADVGMAQLGWNECRCTSTHLLSHLDARLKADIGADQLKTLRGW